MLLTGRNSSSRDWSVSTKYESGCGRQNERRWEGLRGRKRVREAHRHKPRPPKTGPVSFSMTDGGLNLGQSNEAPSRYI